MDSTQWLIIVGAVAALIIGFAVATMLPSQDAAVEALMREQFHLPPDVELQGFRVDQRRVGGEWVQAIARFTPDQYDRYVSSFIDASVWTLHPFSFRGQEVRAVPSADAFRWRSGSEAFMSGGQALRWLDWGSVHTVSQDGLPNVWNLGERRSFCFGVQGEGDDQRVASCSAFGPRDVPDLYFRAVLDERDQRLFLFAE